MFVTYKITCNITGEYYIGSHKTDNVDDNYMGSGKLIRESIKQYGVENHKKEILGVFETRQDSLDLEHILVQRCRKEDSAKCLNRTNGGFSFDYINDNLVFDRASFASLASHESAKQVRQDNIKRYEQNPKRCLVCNKILDYDHRLNTFCSHSCAATYNNTKRGSKRGSKNEPVYCKFCGNLLPMKHSHKRQFCNNSCAMKYRQSITPKQMSDKRKVILANLDLIRERHKTESYRRIALDYGVSAQFIKEALKGRLS